MSNPLRRLHNSIPPTARLTVLGIACSVILLVSVVTWAVIVRNDNPPPTVPWKPIESWTNPVLVNPVNGEADPNPIVHVGGVPGSELKFRVCIDEDEQRAVQTHVMSSLRPVNPPGPTIALSNTNKEGVETALEWKPGCHNYTVAFDVPFAVVARGLPATWQLTSTVTAFRPNPKDLSTDETAVPVPVVTQVFLVVP